MSDLIAQHPSVADFYDNLHVIDGAVLDEDSYHKHMAVPSADTVSIDMPAQSNDPFDTPQDFGQVAENAFESDRQEEYRPECAAFLVPVSHSDSDYVKYVETTALYHPETMRILLGASQIVRNGSGSYHTSGLYYRSSGSYRVSSGSFYVSSGSFHSTSFHTHSGNSQQMDIHTSSSSKTSHIHINSSQSFDKPSRFLAHTLSIKDLPCGMNVGGYGLNLI